MSERDPHPSAAPDAGAPQEGAEPTPIHRPRTEEELIDALSTVCHFVWHRKLRPGEHLWSIPADKERDFDCILSDGITELIELRRQLAAPVHRHVFTPDPTGTACGVCGGWPDDTNHTPPVRDMGEPTEHGDRICEWCNQQVPARHQGAAPDAGAPQEGAEPTAEKNLAELIKAEAAYRENEQHMLRKLSRILSDGNASTWDEIVHAAEQLAPAAHQERTE